MTDPISAWSNELAALFPPEEADRLRLLLENYKSNLLSFPDSPDRVKRLVFLARVLNDPYLKAEEFCLMEELFRKMGLDPAHYTIQIGTKRRDYAADILFHDQELTPAFLIAALNYSEEDAQAAASAARQRDQTDECPALEGDICPPELDWDTQF